MPKANKTAKITALEKLFDDVAYDLFKSDIAEPLIAYLEAWRSGHLKRSPKYILSVLFAYRRMLENCKDGRYGKIR